VGAGPAGLAVGACLKQAGISCLILEQADKVGVAWHRHYERLHLHTDKKHSALPFVPFPTWPGQDSFQGGILHSSVYQDGEPFRGQDVLIVGFGNSGGEIAIDLWEPWRTAEPGGPKSSQCDPTRLVWHSNSGHWNPAK
jgi:cation diffusion facilitator CzcD-associated flavoprotein CzcO